MNLPSFLQFLQNSNFDQSRLDQNVIQGLKLNDMLTCWDIISVRSPFHVFQMQDHNFLFQLLNHTDSLSNLSSDKYAKPTAPIKNLAKCWN